MIVLNKSVTIINKISKNMNNITEIINQNLWNISKALDRRDKQLNFFEALINYNTGTNFFRFVRKNKAFIYFFRSNV